MAQTYHILDIREHPAGLVATLACGLGDDSRVVRKFAERSCTPDTMLLASIFDSLNLLHWRMSDGSGPRPASIAARLSGQIDERDIAGFSDGTEFDRELRRLRGDDNG